MRAMNRDRSRARCTCAAGGTCCAEATDECVEVDEYFSQCRPMTSDEGVVG